VIFSKQVFMSVRKASVEPLAIHRERKIASFFSPGVENTRLVAIASGIDTDDEFAGDEPSFFL